MTTIIIDHEPSTSSSRPCLKCRKAIPKPEWLCERCKKSNRESKDRSGNPVRTGRRAGHDGRSDS